ncbi:putative mannosyltransferase [Lipomyces japonicus]|uniref:putative mannosyltransferase n=1 Tax=Lipomyces japonicus TaxID=56871 RepID=UPI0034D001EB
MRHGNAVLSPSYMLRKLSKLSLLLTAVGLFLACGHFLFNNLNARSMVTGIDHQDVSVRLENATFVMLVRNNEVHSARTSIRYVEDRFNHKYHYPWIFLNDRPFSRDFKAMTENLVSGEATYAQIPREHWSMPDWVDKQKAKKCLKSFAEKGILYGGSESYRHMCRFFSGFMAKQPELLKYDYYWRVEPNTQLYCDIDYDPFTFMRTNNKKYGWVINLKEFASTIESLWGTVQNFTLENPQYVHPNNSVGFIVNDHKNITSGSYNLCHYWSNFEIAALDFWRSPVYTEYFEYLDRTGNFFYERWGDAPVHSIAASIFLDREEVHWFYDIGYRHHPFTHCPEPRKEFHESGKCYCNPLENFDRNYYSCSREYKKMLSKPVGYFEIDASNHQKDDVRSPEGTRIQKKSNNNDNNKNKMIEINHPKFAIINENDKINEKNARQQARVENLKHAGVLVSK